MYKMSYLLEDDDFVMKIHVPIEPEIYNQRGDASLIPSGLITTYKKWERNVPKNLALFYATSLPPTMPLEEKAEFVTIDATWTDEFFPACEYRTKYLKCTLNQLKLLNFAGKTNNAKPVARAVL